MLRMVCWQRYRALARCATRPLQTLLLRAGVCSHGKNECDETGADQCTVASAV